MELTEAKHVIRLMLSIEGATPDSVFAAISKAHAAARELFTGPEFERQNGLHTILQIALADVTGNREYRP